MTPQNLSPLDYRIPQWNSSGLVERVCPLCASCEPIAEFRRPDGLIVNECRKCGLYYVSPAPNEETLNEFYKEYWARHQGHFQNHKTLKNLQRQVKRYKNTTFYVVMKKTVDFRNLPVLDIGCGMGTFLYAAKTDGAVPFGVDLDPEAVTFCNEMLSLENVREADTLQYLKNPPEEYGLILLFDLFEHPLQIGEIVRSALDALRIGGYLAIWTPNGSTFTKDDNPLALRVDLEHMQYLTSKALNHFLNGMQQYEIAHYEELGFHHPPLTAPPVFRSTLKKIIPGGLLEMVRGRNLRLYNKRERTGNYHLFTILRKVK